MGKIRTRFIGDEEVEKKQKTEQKKRSQEKKEAAGEKPTAEVMQKTEDVTNEDTTPESTKKKAKLKPTVTGKKQGKKHSKAVAQVDKTKSYQVDEAIELLKKISYASFEESLELHLNVAVDGLKGEIELPHSTGKTVRVVIASDDVLADIEKGNINFDVLITHPSFMPKLAKYAKTLGPKGLMPNPKAGTVSTEPEKVAQKFEKGMLRWKAEAKFPLIHQLVGKMKAETKDLNENVVAFINAVGKKNIKMAFIKSTMSPSLKLDLEAIA
ncbi:MAG: hypothetical protein ACEQSA_00145 [Weeksellaceae bacterium]